jgi:uncharacterized protein YbjQ (UPF0145 family)
VTCRVWRTCSLRGKRTTDERCPECDMLTENASMGLLGQLNAPIPEPKAAAHPLIVTTNEIAGYRIDAVCGDVFGLVVMSRHVFSNVGASLKTVVGGEVRGYTELLRRSRNEARERLWHEAVAAGANAVVAMRFDCNTISDLMTEVAA